MTIYRKCRLCLKRDGCSIKADIGKAVSGLGITSILHKCASYEPPFKPGDPVLVTTICDWNGDDWEPEGIPTAVFPGHYLDQYGAKAHVYIKPGTEDVGGNQFPFVPKSNGYCTLSFSRVAPNPNGETIKLCHGIPDFECDCFGLTQ
ncbi:hypothetical protein LCGC14_2499470 [marine sediment metagenome]|uniref:Uncharacterized protein n=1 Tax=marine sediment metagenome TaxID=412755 RepID=A0A0F9B275_9ZZZZ